MPGKQRAKPLSPDDRRRSIIDAVLPLLIEQGASVTTKQIAEAAGVAEGTIFGVFPDKTALISETIKVIMDPEPVLAALAGIEESAPIDAQLRQVGTILLERHEQVIALLSILRGMSDHKHTHSTESHRFVHESIGMITNAVADLIARHDDALRIEPEKAAVAFRSLVFASAHPVLKGDVPLTVAEIVELLMAGIFEPNPGEAG